MPSGYSPLPSSCEQCGGKFDDLSQIVNPVTIFDTLKCVCSQCFREQMDKIAGAE